MGDMTFPAQMNAVIITRPGAADGMQLQPVPMPSCGDNDVLIRVAAAGVNGPDIAQRRGHYDPPPGASQILGLEVSGEIVAIGSQVRGWAVGNRVMALTNGGGYAEYVVVPSGQVLPAPKHWALSEAAALPETWFTVTQTLVMRAGLETGMTVLVHGAAGGIGSAAVQIGKILGARSVAVVSSSEKADYASKLGAFATIDYSTEDVAAKAMVLTNGVGVDRVVDIVGGTMTAINIAACGRGAHIVQVSTLDGRTADVPLGVIMAKQLTLSGSTLRPQTPATKAAIASRIRMDLLPALDDPNLSGPRSPVSLWPMPPALTAPWSPGKSWARSC